jgi:hypothetical protein
MRDYGDLLASEYCLDLTSDPCVITLCRADGTMVARFTHASDPQEVRRAADEDLEETH